MGPLNGDAMARAGHLPTRAGSLNAMLKSSTLVVGSRIGGAVLGMVAQVFLARILSAEDLGNFFIALSLATVLAIVSTLGYPWIVPVILARADAAARPHRAAAFLAWARREIGILSASLAVLGLVLVLVLPSFTPHTRLILAVGVLTAPVFAFMRLYSAVANARRRFALAYLPELFWRPFLLLSLIVALWILFGSFDLVTLLIGHLAIALALTANMGLRLSAGATEEGALAAADRLNPGRRGQGRRWRARAMPMVVATLFVAVFADLDLLFAGTVLNDAHTGVFGVCIKISMFLAFSIQAVHQVILRDAADALQSRDRAALDALLFKANATAFLVSVSAVIGAALLARQVLALFGPEFVQGALCLVILTIAQAVRAAAGPAAQILALTGHQRTTVPVFAAGLVLLLAVNLALVPLYGLVGAALAVLIVTAIWSVWLSFIVRARVGVNVTLVRRPPATGAVSVAGNPR